MYGELNDRSRSPMHKTFIAIVLMLLFSPALLVKDHAAVQKDMQEKVLEIATFPQIRFESTAIRKIAEGTWSVAGNLSLHGKTNPVTADVHVGNNAYAGQAVIRQSQFGIKPVSAA